MTVFVSKGDCGVAALVIRSLNADDITQALDLVGRVFSEFIAPGYSEEGIAEFNKFIEPSYIIDNMLSGEFKLWGAYENDRITGVIAIKPPLHITLLFVDKRCHRLGIARKLFETVINYEMITHEHDRVTVFSSPYAVEIYRRMGFTPTDTEQTVNGLRFTPMEHVFH
jgi:GNAT superfamily N-acetyltransferase